MSQSKKPSIQVLARSDGAEKIGFNTETVKAALERGQQFVQIGGKKYRVVAAVLRQDSVGAGWYALDDAGHTPLGISSVETTVDGQRIQVNYDFSGQAIGAVSVVSDESFAAFPMQFGASVGNSKLFIDFYHQFGFRSNGTAVAGTGPMGTKGTDWDAVVDAGSGTITVTHGSSTHSDSQGWPVFATLKDSADAATSVRVTASSKTGYTLQAMGPLAANVRVADVLYSGVDTITRAWDGVDTLTITHPDAQSIDDAQVTSKEPRYHAAVVNRAIGSTQVQFFDCQTGALYTGGSQPTNVQFSRSASVAPYPITGSTEIQSGRLGLTKIPASGIAGSSRNLWLYGLFEVA